MRTSDRGVAFLAAHEGIVPGPYLDSVGVWTTGIGHTAAAGAPDPRTLPRGMPADLDAALRDVFAIFRRDLAKYEADVARVVGNRGVAQHEFDAAVSFHFNTGAIGRATWVKHWLAGSKTAAAQSMMEWRKPSEIIPRRTAERDLFQSGTYGATRASVWPVNEAGRITWRPIRTLTQAEIIGYLRPATPAPSPAPTMPSIPVSDAAPASPDAAPAASPAIVIAILGAIAAVAAHLSGAF